MLLPAPSSAPRLRWGAARGPPTPGITAGWEKTDAVFRAGAGILITYYAKELAQAILKGEIG